MRFHRGEPATAGFEPENDPQWQRLDEPDIRRFKRWAEIGMLVLMPVLGAAWWWLYCLIDRPGDSSPYAVPFAFLSLPVLFVLHEVLHMLVHPRRGWFRDSTLGALPKQGMLYAYYPGEMSRNRLLACLLLPFAALTALPWLVCLWSREFSLYWATLSFINGFGAVGDLLAVYLLLRGVPAHGIVRNQGWQTWWRVRSG